MKEIDNSKSQIRLPIFLALAVIAGIFIGATIGGKGNISTKYFSGYNKFREVIGHIEQDYVDEVDTDELVETAITRMLDKLDPHSIYIPPSDRELTSSQLEGTFEGVGIEFNIFRDTLFVVAPISGGPSEKVGVKAGDKIISVDSKGIAGVGLTQRQVFDYLRGPKGSEVKIAVLRTGVTEAIDFVIVRDKIPQYSVDVSYMVDDEIGYIKVSRFATTTFQEFQSAVSDLKDKGMKKMILDLQGNPGGIMGAAINMVDELLAGTSMIVYTDGKDDKNDSEAHAIRKGQFESEPVIVLIDEGSASASEIVAGALQDNDRALIVGRRSFGKGLVQMPIGLSDGAELRLTVSRYFTPSGRSIQKVYESDNFDTYSSEIVDRYNKGEFFHADSITFVDSLKYTTSKGRTVYGGGGIMPDYFVPLDTTKNSNYMFQLFGKNVIREYSLSYYEKNAKQLAGWEFNDFKSNFEITDQMLEALVQLSSKAGVEYNETQFEKSKGVLRLHVKAQIARSVWNGNGFFPILNKENEAFQSAMKLFGEAEKIMNLP